MMGCGVPGLTETAAGAGCDGAPPVASMGRASGAGGRSRSSFWNSKTASCCGLPSSVRLKSPCLRFSMTLPDLSFTATSMMTRVVFVVKVTVGCWAGMGATASTTASVDVRIFFITSPCRSALSIGRNEAEMRLPLQGFTMRRALSGALDPLQAGDWNNSIRRAYINCQGAVHARTVHLSLCNAGARAGDFGPDARSVYGSPGEGHGCGLHG